MRSFSDLNCLSQFMLERNHTTIFTVKVLNILTSLFSVGIKACHWLNDGPNDQGPLLSLRLCPRMGKAIRSSHRQRGMI